MSNPNDSRIIDLKAQIEKARAEVGAALKFAPKTSCVYDIDGVKYNLHAASQPDLLYLLAKLTALHSGAAAHGLEGELTICGFPIRDCIDDVIAKYIAYKAGLPFFYVNFSFLLGQYLGETQKSLGRIFEFVRKTPCVFCFDELDAVALKRGASSDVGEMNRVVIALMQELDRVQNDNIIIATTNRFDSIDPALYRRFSHIEEVKKLAEYDALKMAEQFFDYVEMPKERKRQSDLAMLRLTFHPGSNPCVVREYTPAQVQSVCIEEYLHYIESEARDDRVPKVL